jgi:hypothetical protein
LPTGDRLKRETALGLFPAEAGYSHAASGKCDLDRRFESQRRIKVDAFRQFKRAVGDVAVERLDRATELRCSLRRGEQAAGRGEARLALAGWLGLLRRQRCGLQGTYKTVEHTRAHAAISAIQCALDLRSEISGQVCYCHVGIFAGKVGFGRKEPGERQAIGGKAQASGDIGHADHSRLALAARCRQRAEQSRASRRTAQNRTRQMAQGRRVRGWRR